jgi:hypothetical protein
LCPEKTMSGKGSNAEPSGVAAIGSNNSVRPRLNRPIAEPDAPESKRAPRRQRMGPGARRGPARNVWSSFAVVRCGDRPQ